MNLNLNIQTKNSFSSFLEKNSFEGLSNNEIFLYEFCKNYKLMPEIISLTASKKFSYKVKSEKFIWESLEVFNTYGETVKAAIKTCDSIISTILNIKK